MDWKKIQEMAEDYSEASGVALNLIIMKRSDHYPAASFRSSLSILVLTFLTLYYIPYDIQDPIWIMALMIPSIFLGHFLTLFSPYKRLFVASSEMKEECYQQALEMGHQHGLLGNDSLYIFISLFERRIEILFPQSFQDKGKVESSSLFKTHFKKLLHSLKKKENQEQAFSDFFKHIVKIL